jgi:hypothetical protein
MGTLSQQTREAGPDPHVGDRAVLKRTPTPAPAPRQRQGAVFLKKLWQYKYVAHTV